MPMVPPARQLLSGLEEFWRATGTLSRAQSVFIWLWSDTRIVAAAMNTPDFRPDVIVTVDNGIANHAGVKLARESGVTVVITDHHLPAGELPVAQCHRQSQSAGRSIFQ